MDFQSLLSHVDFIVKWNFASHINFSHLLPSVFIKELFEEKTNWGTSPKQTKILYLRRYYLKKHTEIHVKATTIYLLVWSKHISLMCHNFKPKVTYFQEENPQSWSGANYSVFTFLCLFSLVYCILLEFYSAVFIIEKKKRKTKKTINK